MSCNGDDYSCKPATIKSNASGTKETVFPLPDGAKKLQATENKNKKIKSS
jgi:hypothetical protein